MPTVPRYPPSGIPRCPICDAPYQTCTGHPPDWNSSPQYLIGVRLPKRVSAPVGAVGTQAFAYPPNVKGISMAAQNEATTPAPRKGGVHRTFPRPAPEEQPAPAPAPAPKPEAPKSAPKTDAPKRSAA